MNENLVTPDLESLDKENLQVRLAGLEKDRDNVEVFAGNLGRWYASQKQTIFGQLLEHVENQIIAADTDSKEHAKLLRPELPIEADRIAMRKKFHRSALHSLRFNIGWATILIFLPYFFDFLDNCVYLTPLGPAIYPIIAICVFVLAITIIIIRAVRVRRKFKRTQAKLSASELLRPNVRGSSNLEILDDEESNQEQITPQTNIKKAKYIGPWPASKIVRWILGAVLFSAVISIWPIAGLFAKIAAKSPFFPSGWQIVLAAIAIFVFRFTHALIVYYRGYRSFFRKVETAWDLATWASGGTLRIRTAIRRFESLKKQIHYWNRVLGSQLRNPWRISTPNLSSEDDLSLQGSFPISIQLAYALDQDSGDQSARIKLEALRRKLYLDETRKGWRKSNFESFFENDFYLGNFAADGKLLVEALSRGQIGFETPLSEALDNLVQDENYLEYIGTQKEKSLLPEVQNQILSNGHLRVQVLQPGRNQRKIMDWDEHLRRIVTREQDGRILPFESMKDWAFKDNAKINGPAKNVVTFICGPARLLDSLKENRDRFENSENMLTNSGDDSSIVWEKQSENVIRNVDLLLRLDVLGVRQPILVGDLLLPHLSKETKVNVSLCSNCGLASCPGVVQPENCDYKG